MRFRHRLSLIAKKGVSLFHQRTPPNNKDNETETAHDKKSAAEEFRLLTEAFNRKVRQMGLGFACNYNWYHTVDLGDGLVTPGCYDYRSVVSAFNFPDQMSGMNVLDVGSASGFFAFEFERRGANVVSVEVPSIADWDRFPGETPEQLREKIEEVRNKLDPDDAQGNDALYRKSTLEELYQLGLDGPFKFCHQMLKSKVQRRYSKIYDVSKESVGRDDFDLVFIGDVLLHTISPLEALAAVATLCKGTLILTQELINFPDDPPAILYVGGDKLGEDHLTWFLPNKSCTEQWLRKLGFKNVALAGEHRGVTRPSGISYKRAVFHASR